LKIISGSGDELHNVASNGMYVAYVLCIFQHFYSSILTFYLGHVAVNSSWHINSGVCATV
jgi:hypothetical protein